MHSPSKSPLVSILIPCKDAALYIDECISSILKQTYTHWELIIVDDHSTDQTPSTLQHWTQNQPNIKVIPNVGSGIINALRLAYSDSKGVFITRMDADDIMTPTKLSTMIRQLESAGPGEVATGKVKYFRIDQPIGNGYLRYAEWLNSLSVRGTNFQDIYKECVIPSPCWMMYREDLDRIGAFDSDIYPEDYDLVLRMYQHKLKVIPSSDEILHLWRDHSTRASRNDDNYKDNRFLELKVKYFLKIDYNIEKTLVIWGAGTKAKLIAKRLIAAQVKFHWITDNEKKIGHDIYGVILSSTSQLAQLDKSQIILTVANPKEQEEIKNHINSIQSNDIYQTIWFC